MSTTLNINDIKNLLEQQNDALNYLKLDTNTSFDTQSILSYSKAFHFKPILPISYSNNKEYDEFQSALNELTVAHNSPIDNALNNYTQYISYALNNNNKDVFNYYNSIYSSYVTNQSNATNSYIDNKFILKYEDIILKSGDKYIKLDEKTNINDFIKAGEKGSNNQNEVETAINTNFLKSVNYTGAFLYPDIDTIQQVQIQDGDKQSVIIRPGESISIPITFEFYIANNDNSTQSSISKSLIFCIKDSQYNEPKYYEIEITGNNSINDTNSIYTTIDNFTLSDTLT